MKLSDLRLRRRLAARDPDAPRWRLPRPGQLRASLRNNPGLKLVSLLLACFLWYSINALERDAERVIEIPVSIRKTPADLIVTTPPTKPVMVTLRGPRTILDGVDEGRTRLVVDLSGAAPGETRIEFNEGMLVPELPRRLKALRMQPARLKVRVEPLAKKRLPVRLNLAGSPALGYRITGSSITPDHVEVSGPRSKVEGLTEIATESVSLHGLAKPLDRNVPLEWVADYVSVVPDRVRVRVQFEEEVVTREFRNVRVHVLNAENAKLGKATVDITVSAPQRLLHNFKLSGQVATVDAAGLDPGAHQLPVQVNLPPGFDVTGVDPQTVEVTLPAASGGR
jgi:YbbR domain-containing protein